MSAAKAHSSSMGKPSSITKAAEIQAGRAPITARSFTVPWIARWPIEPPGNRSGCTTKESVLNARDSPEGSGSTAPSQRRSSSLLRNASRKTASTSAADALPPAPCAMVTTSSSRRGRRRRNASIFSSTCSSRTTGPVRSRPRRFSSTLIRSLPFGQAALHRGPQQIPENGLGLLDAVHALRPHHEAEIDIPLGGEPATVVPGEPDGEQPAALRLLERAQQVGGAAARGHGERDVGLAGVRDELP